MRHGRKDGIGTPALAAWVIGIVLASTACASGPATQAAPTQPAAAPSPATRPQAADPNVLRILADLEAVGLKYATLEANVWFHLYKTMEKDEELRTGRIVIARGGGKGPDRLYIRFDTLKQGEGSTLQDKIEYALDGQWLVEAKHRIKTLTRYQVAAPGQRVELFRLGQGPFPMPFGQKAADVLEHFEASTRPPIATDPNGTDYVKLVTRPAYKDELSFLQLEMWVDRQTRLPVKLVTRDRNKDIKTAVFSAVRANEKVDEKLFLVEEKTGWQLNVVPLKRD